MNQTVRIIGGLYRGKKIHFPTIDGLRPTPDRIKETLFNWLMHDIRDSHCLDAFAGSGALGLEAFSRGAAEVVFTESNPDAYQALTKTIATFKSSQLTLLQKNALHYLKTTTKSFDIIFLDPPFAQDYLNECVDCLQNNNCLRKGGLVYVESGEKIELNEHYWKERKAKKAGQVYYALFEKM